MLFIQNSNVKCNENLNPMRRNKCKFYHSLGINYLPAEFDLYFTKILLRNLISKHNTYFKSLFHLLQLCFELSLNIQKYNIRFFYLLLFHLKLQTVLLSITIVIGKQFYQVRKIIFIIMCFLQNLQRSR